MVSPELAELKPSSPMAKSANRNNRSSFCVSEGFLFLGGAFLALLFVWSLRSFTSSGSGTNPSPIFQFNDESEDLASHSPACNSGGPNLGEDPPDSTFYDDPGMSYSIEDPVRGWDEKRKKWLKQHPSFAGGGRERVLLVTGSQPSPCKNPIGDSLLLRAFKNKVDYCRIHGYDIFYNTALLHPRMRSFWAKIPAVRAAMLAHPEVEWIWWVDSDALITDMEFRLPLERYKGHNLVVHGWPHLIYEKQSWTSLNAGVFLIRNCQWSMELMEVWAKMGPQSPEYEKWGQLQRSIFKDKLFPEADDQTGLIYLLYKEKDKYGDKIYLENDYYFEGYWTDIVTEYDNITRRYQEMDKGDRVLRRRHAEKVTEFYGATREDHLGGIPVGGGEDRRRRPFITHFTGCEPCTGEHNQMYTAEACWDGMSRALNFADNQVLRNYGFMHPTLRDFSVSPVPFNFPA